MRKLLSLTLLIVHLFNLTGYTLLFKYLGGQSTSRLISQIDKHNYSEADLIEIKTVLNLPYQSTWSEYERHDGEITIDGANYSYVKRKVSGDTLYLLCLPNAEKDKLNAAESDFVANVNSKSDDSGDHHTVWKSAFTQFQVTVEEFTFTSPIAITSTWNNLPDTALPDSFTCMDGKPPRLNI